MSVIELSETATRMAGQTDSRCSRVLRRGEATTATAVTTPLVASPSENSCPVSRVDISAVRATRNAATVCNPMAGTAPTTSTASSDPSSPKPAGTSRRAATTLSR